MTYPFDLAEEELFDFEKLLDAHGLKINKGSDLERISIEILTANAKYKNQIVHDNQTDIRSLFSDIAGLIDFVKLILKHKDHADFPKLIPHLALLNSSDSAVMTNQSKVTDSGNNKLFELYIALLCMSFSNEIELDHPNSSKGNNPDILFSFKDRKWAIACKALHSNKEKTLFDTIEKATDQIIQCDAEKGIVLVNLKNIIDREKLWPLTNPDAYKNGADPEFTCFQSMDEPLNQLRHYGVDLHDRLLTNIGLNNLVDLNNNIKTSPAFLAFLQAVTSVYHNGYCPITILKTFNIVKFEEVDLDYMELADLLNKAMHFKI